MSKIDASKIDFSIVKGFGCDFLAVFAAKHAWNETSKLRVLKNLNHRNLLLDEHKLLGLRFILFDFKQFAQRKCPAEAFKSLKKGSSIAIMSPGLRFNEVVM